MTIKQTPNPLSRRRFIRLTGGALIATPVLGLIGCGSGGTSLTQDESESSSSTVDETTDSSTSTSETSETTETSSTETTSTNSTDWAEGGTDAITINYPPASPFTESLGSICSATASYTLGPCYFAPDDYRDDISEGQQGVPMIICLKVVDENCDPVEGADVDLWHCNWEGIYSGDSADSSDSSSFSTAFCTDNDSEALASKWFRGVQTTDEEGLVYFKSCFPGWYSSRTTHIHFKIIHNNVEYLVSQFCFDDDLSNDIYLNHSEYTGESKDTANSSDTVFGSDYEEYQFAVSKNEDNSMLAYKTIQISS